MKLIRIIFSSGIVLLGLSVGSILYNAQQTRNIINISPINKKSELYMTLTSLEKKNPVKSNFGPAVFNNVITIDKAEAYEMTYPKYDWIDCLSGFCPTGIIVYEGDNNRLIELNPCRRADYQYGEIRDISHRCIKIFTQFLDKYDLSSGMDKVSKAKILIKLACHSETGDFPTIKMLPRDYEKQSVGLTKVEKRMISFADKRNPAKDNEVKLIAKYGKHYAANYLGDIVPKEEWWYPKVFYKIAFDKKDNIKSVHKVVLNPPTEEDAKEINHKLGLDKE